MLLTGHATRLKMQNIIGDRNLQVRFRVPDALSPDRDTWFMKLCLQRLKLFQKFCAKFL